MASFQLIFSVQGTGDGLTGPDPEKSVGDQEVGSPSRPVSSALQVPREPGQNKTTLVNFPRRFSFKMSFNCTSRDK